MPPDDRESPRPPRKLHLAPFALVTSTAAAFCFLHRTIIPPLNPLIVFAYLRDLRGPGVSTLLTLAYYLPWLLPLAYLPAFPLIRRLSPASQWDVAIGCVVALVCGYSLWPAVST